MYLLPPCSQPYGFCDAQSMYMHLPDFSFLSRGLRVLELLQSSTDVLNPYDDLFHEAEWKWRDYVGCLLCCCKRREWSSKAFTPCCCPNKKCSQFWENFYQRNAFSLNKVEVNGKIHYFVWTKIPRKISFLTHQVITFPKLKILPATAMQNWHSYLQSMSMSPIMAREFRICS